MLRQDDQTQESSGSSEVLPKNEFEIEISRSMNNPGGKIPSRARTSGMDSRLAVVVACARGIDNAVHHRNDRMDRQPYRKMLPQIRLPRVVLFRWTRLVWLVSEYPVCYGWIESIDSDTRCPSTGRDDRGRHHCSGVFFTHVQQ